ncbi:MAG TPA: hypothetical protein DGF10_04685, partial [Acidimicrobiaceae bacterium]|nr:hypothetical protein [Acidimicrobiaceae bacterium]HCV33943.1 hypothetical protein [Acidimicrobiaceae bacterium]
TDVEVAVVPSGTEVTFVVPGSETGAAVGSEVSVPGEAPPHAPTNKTNTTRRLHDFAPNDCITTSFHKHSWNAYEREGPRADESEGTESAWSQNSASSEPS